MWRAWVVVTVLALALLCAGGAGAQGTEVSPEGAAAGPLGTAFTYQGQLKQGGAPVNGPCDFRFQLWDAAGGGSQVGSLVEKLAVQVTAGVFTTLVDAGGAAFAGEARWLEISVRCPAGGAYVTLPDRQPLMATPYALWAKGAPWSGISGVPAASGDATGTYPALTVSGLRGRALASTAPGTGQVLKWNGSQWAPAPDEIGTPGTGDITAVYAGAGLTGGGESNAVTLSASFAGNGGANSVARSDHNHDAAYVNEGAAVTVTSPAGNGVAVTGASEDGVYIQSASGFGISIYDSGAGAYIARSTGYGVGVLGTGGDGI